MQIKSTSISDGERRVVNTMFLEQRAYQLPIDFRAKQIAAGKTKEPVRTSLNNWNEIRITILNLVHQKFKITPATLYPLPGELHEYLTGKVPDWVRINWYLRVSKYRNNFRVR